MEQQLTNRSIRKTNTANVVMSLIRAGESTRGELAKHNRISVMTVKKIVDELMALGIVQEKAALDTGLGRKPMVLQISSRLGVCVCISLASTGFLRYAIYNLYGDLLEQRSCGVEDARPYQACLADLLQTVKRDIDRIGLELVGVGVCVPGAYARDDGLASCGPMPVPGDLYLRTVLQEAFVLANIQITHDVFAAALAEYDLMRQPESLFYCYVGDGVEGAFIERDVRRAGHNRLAGGIGHMIVQTERGERTLADCASVPALWEQLREICPGKTFSQLLDLYDGGASPVVEVIDRAAGHIARCLYNTAWVLNPRCIVVGSSYRRYAQRIVRAVGDYNRRRDNPTMPAGSEVTVSRLPKYAELRGCFHLLRRGWVESL